MDVWVYFERNEKYRAQRITGLASVSLVIKSDRLRWFGYIEHEDDDDRVEQCMSVEI